MAHLVCKFHVNTVKAVRNQGKDGWHSEEIIANAVHGDSPENKEWSKWTPSGQLTLQITNEAAFGRLLPGDEIMIEITRVEKLAKATE